MTAPDDAIRARRKLLNKFIAAKTELRLKPFFTENVTVIVGDGGMIHGADPVIDAFGAQFRDPTFISYVRTTDTVDLDDEAERAAERGHWIGTWKGGAVRSGVYLAAWRKQNGQWVIESELYITLGGTAGL